MYPFLTNGSVPIGLLSELLMAQPSHWLIVSTSVPKRCYLLKAKVIDVRRPVTIIQSVELPRPRRRWWRCHCRFAALLRRSCC